MITFTNVSHGVQGHGILTSISLSRNYLLLCQREKINELGLRGFRNSLLSLKIFIKIDKLYEQRKFYQNGF